MVKKIAATLIVRLSPPSRRTALTFLAVLVTRDTSDGKDHKGLIKKLWSELSEKGIIRHSLTNPHYWKSLDVKWVALPCEEFDAESTRSTGSMGFAHSPEGSCAGSTFSACLGEVALLARSRDVVDEFFAGTRCLLL